MPLFVKFTTLQSFGMMVSRRGNYPKIALFQVSALLQLKQRHRLGFDHRTLEHAKTVHII